MSDSLRSSRRNVSLHISLEGVNFETPKASFIYLAFTFSSVFMSCLLRVFPISVQYRSWVWHGKGAWRSLTRVLQYILDLKHGSRSCCASFLCRGDCFSPMYSVSSRCRL
ncbi:hypothetical protein C0J52_20458 [Blattella germanica]|nr:hypothetical protein C0J52_20458 [Blattella germanica]